MKLLFLSDLHLPSWKNTWINILHDRLYDAIKYGLIDIPNTEDDRRLTVVLGGDFYTAFTEEELDNIIQQEAKGGIDVTLRSNQYYLNWLYVLRDKLEEFLSIDDMFWYYIDRIIVSPGNHDIWDKSFNNASEKTIKSILSKAFEVERIFLSYIFPNVEIVVQEFFDIPTKLSDKTTIIGGMMYSPIASLKMNYFYSEDNNEKNELVVSSIRDAGLFEKYGNDYDYILGNELQSLLQMKDPFVGLNMEFDMLEPKLAQFLKEEYKKMKELNKNNAYNYIQRSDYDYFVKAYLYFFSDINNIIKTSQSLPKDELLIVNHHFPFDLAIVENMDQVFDSIDFSYVHLFDSSNSPVPSARYFFNIDISWLPWLLKQLKQDNIIFLSGHTHEQYKADLIYNEKNIHILNTNIWYGMG